MDLLILAKVLVRKLWIILSIPLIAAFAAYLFTMDMKDVYHSTAQISTGYTMNDQVQLTEEKFNSRDADIKFSNLLNVMNSGLAMNLLSYKLLLHDLEGKEPPFHRPDAQSFSASEKEIDMVREIVQRKLARLSPLSTTDPEFSVIRKFLEAYGYGYNEIRDNLVVDRVINTDFVQVDFYSDKPKLSAFAVNSYCQEFIRYHESLKSERTGESVDFLKQVVDNKKAELDEKLEAQRKFTSTNQVYNADESDIKLSQLASLETERDMIRNRLYRSELTIKRLQDDINRLSTPSTSNNNQKIIDLMNQISRLNERYVTTGSRNQALLDSLNILREQLRIQQDNATRQGPSIPEGYTVADLQIKLKDAQIDHDVESSSLSLVESKIRNLQYSFSGSAPKEAKLAAIQKEVDLASAEYLQAVEKYNLAKSKMLGSNSLRQVLTAIPPAYPETSTRWLIVGLAAFTSLAICAFVIIAAEVLDGSIKTPDRFKRMVGLPLIGVINRIDSRYFNIRTYFNQENGSDETEMFKSLLRKFRHEVESMNAKVILFTSPKRRDGKTFIMFSLAYVLSLIDKRVLIIDTNFKNNSLSQILGRNHGDLKVLDSRKSKLLVSANGETRKEQQHEYEHENSYDLINPTKYRNIYIVGNSGGGHESPAEILSGRDFTNLIGTFADSFDYVLLEGAALNEYSDTKELARYADKVVAVFTADSPIRQLDRDSIQYFKSLGKKFGGSVLNRVDTKDFKL